MSTFDITGYMLTPLCRTKNPFPVALQKRQKDPSPPPTRQSQLNYAMMKEGALRKKLQEIGIPNWGTKDLMKRRHIEWLNIYNSNCDADESVRKPKRQLIKELEEWENTQGGRADIRESRVMRKDFDGSGYAKSHKSDFDDLIAQARKKRAISKPEDEKEMNENSDENSQIRPQADPEPVTDMAHVPKGAEKTSLPMQQNGVGTQGLKNHETNVKPYQDSTQTPNHAAAAQASETVESMTTVQDEVPLGIQNPLGSPSRKVPMFSLPGDPIKEVDMSFR